MCDQGRLRDLDRWVRSCGEELPNDLLHHCRFRRFDEVVRRASPEGSEGALGRTEDGGDDDDQVWLHLEGSLQNLQAVEVWQHEVEQHHVDALGTHDFQRLSTAVGAEVGVVSLEGKGVELVNGTVVIDREEDGSSLPCHDGRDSSVNG